MDAVSDTILLLRNYFWRGQYMNVITKVEGTNLVSTPFKTFWCYRILHLKKKDIFCL